MTENPNLPIGETCSVDSGMAKESLRQVSEFTDFDGIIENFKRKWIFEREDFDMMRECLASNDTELIADTPYDHQAVLKYITQIRNSGGFDLDVKLPTYLGPLLVCLIPLDLSNDKNEFTDDSDPDDANHQIPTEREYAYQRARFAIDEINVDMNAETFELVEVVKAVEKAYKGSFMLLTLAVKKLGEAEEAATLTIQAILSQHWGEPVELKEWRFKRDAQA